MTDSAQERQQRLAAMRARRQQGAGADAPEAGEAGVQRPMAARQLAGNGNVRQIVAKILPRLRQLLTQPAPDSPLIPGTPIREQNLAKLVQMLRQRADSPDGAGAKLAGRVLGFLTKDDGGEKTVEGVSIAQLKKLLAFASKAQGMSAGPRGGGGRGGRGGGNAGGGRGGALRSLRGD